MNKHFQSVSEFKNVLLASYKIIERKKTLSIIITSIFVLVLWLIVGILIEERLYLSIEIKSISLLSSFLLAVYLIWSGMKNAHNNTFKDFYRTFSSTSKLKELGYALDLDESTKANSLLVEAAIENNIKLIDKEVFAFELEKFGSTHPIIRRFNLRRIFFILSLLIGAFTVINYQKATIRYFSFYQSFDKPNPYIYTLHPKNITVEQGSPLIISANFNAGILPDEIDLYVKTPIEKEFRKKGLTKNGTIYSSSTFKQHTPLAYFIEMDGFRSELFEIAIQMRPRFTALYATVIPPAYTKLDTSLYEYPFSEIKAIQGSQITLSGKVNKPLSKSYLQTRTTEHKLNLNEDLSFEYNLELLKKDTVTFFLEDINRLMNLNRFQLNLIPIKDEYPIAEIVKPKASYEEIDPKQIEILYKTSDDFGIKKTNLKYELKKAFVDDIYSNTISMDENNNSMLQTYIFNVDIFNLSPKDELSFWIQTSDNDAFNGSKSSRSKTINLNIPSLIEYFEEIDIKENTIESELEDVSNSFNQMQEQYDLFKEELRINPEIDYQSTRQLEGINKKQEQIEKQIDELNKKFENLKKELNDRDILSDETLKAYDELQQLMKEIDDPAFKKALEALQQNLNSMTPEQLREAMELTEFNEQLYKERIERTIDLFKQLKLNADLENLAKSYEDLSRQEQLGDKNEALTNEQKQQSLLDQTEQLEDQLQKLDENTTSKTEPSINDLQKISKDKLNEIKGELKERLDQIENETAKKDSSNQNDTLEDKADNKASNKNTATEPKQEVQEKFEELAKITRDMISKLNQRQKNINIAGLQYILYALINLSNEQEELITYASEAESKSNAFVNYARDQQNILYIFSSLSDSLFKLSKEIPSFSNSINKEKLEVEKLIDRSLIQLAERDHYQAAVATQQTLAGINKISYLLIDLLEQIQNQKNGEGGSGSGMSTQQMIEQMQQMGQNQQQINQQIQDMINDIQGDRLSKDQMERLNQLSKQQNAIRKQLQQIQQNGGARGDEIGSKLERMIEQMEETINDLRGGAVDPTLINRQQTILSRMLEAEKAIQERDEEERREGKSGKDFERVSPPDITLEELEKQIQKRLNDPNFSKYSPDYQQLIERYFELLKEIEKKKVNN